MNEIGNGEEDWGICSSCVKRENMGAFISFSREAFSFHSSLEIVMGCVSLFGFY